jgi:hypothetical protein
MYRCIIATCYNFILYLKLQILIFINFEKKLSQMSDKHTGISKLLPSNLKTNIAEEIGSGDTEGDMLDMQIKNEFDPL